MNVYTAKQVYDRLLTVESLLHQKGGIYFKLGSVEIEVRQRDVVGNILQEWLAGWLSKQDIYHAPNPNSQMPPDFFLDPEGERDGLLEVKAFNRSASPGFDIADFAMYEREICVKPWMLYVDYLIFGYDMSETGVVTVKDLWLKKVWQITRPMGDWALNLQVKNGRVHKMRPGVWFSDKKGNIPMFSSLEDFISAVEQTVYQNPQTRDDSAKWLSNFQRNYKAMYGKCLSVQRWNDIKQYYLPDM